MHRSFLNISLSLFFVLGTLSSAVSGQESFSAKGKIAESATAVIIATPKAMFMSPAMEFVPRELITAFGKRELNIDICEINRMTFVIDAFDDLRRPPGFAYMLEFDSEQSLSEEILEDAELEEFNGNPLYRFESGPETVVVYVPDSKSLVVGLEEFVKETVALKSSGGPLAKLLTESDGSADHIQAFVILDPIREFIDDNLPPADRLPMPLQPFRDLPDEIASIQMTMGFADNANNTLVITGVDEKATKKIARTIEHGISTGRGMLMSYLANEMSDQEEMMDAIEAYDERVGDKLEEMLKPKLMGKNLVFEGESGNKITNAATIGTLIGMLLPAVQQTREAARRTTSMNNLRQLALACLNYESAYMKFPGNICDDDGNPLLSWRVAILPFIEENALYQEFHLDEPWDSEHNIELLDRMPPVFRNPNFDTGNKTSYLGFEGDGTIFEGGDDAIGFGNITDGSSNTILCVETNEDDAIEWSKPSDIEFDPEKEIEVGGFRPGGFLAVLCDGSTHMMSGNLGWESIKNLIQRNDGNVVNW